MWFYVAESQRNIMDIYTSSASSFMEISCKDVPLVYGAQVLSFSLSRSRSKNNALSPQGLTGRSTRDMALQCGMRPPRPHRVREQAIPCWEAELHPPRAGNSCSCVTEKMKFPVVRYWQCSRWPSLTYIQGHTLQAISSWKFSSRRKWPDPVPKKQKEGKARLCV